MATILTSSNEEYIPKELEHIPCMLCGEDNYQTHEIFGNKNQYKYVECKHCSNIYLNPRPVYNDEFTTIAYDQYSMDKDIVVSEGGFSPAARETIERYKVAIHELEKKYKKKGKILDLGCGTGEFLVAAKECGHDVYGIDISAPMVEHVNNNLQIQAKAGQFQDLDLSDWGEFDVIFSSHVIEHIPCPNVWMECFNKYLKKDGILLLNIPNQHAPEKKFQRFLKKLKLRNPVWEGWRTPDHLYEPHLTSMKFLLEKNNFKLLDIFTYSSREKEEAGFFTNVFHKNLKWGSKIRLFAQKK